MPAPASIFKNADIPKNFLKISKLSKILAFILI